MTHQPGRTSSQQGPNAVLTNETPSYGIASPEYLAEVRHLKPAYDGSAKEAVKVTKKSRAHQSKRTSLERLVERNMKKSKE